MAGQIKANQLQLGDSGTATHNFVLQTNVNGTAKLARGNAGATTQDVLTIDAVGKVSAPQGYSDVLGSGQTWQDMTASRALGVTYTNNTGRPIMVCVRGQQAGAGASILTIGGVAVSAANYNANVNPEVQSIVPAGATYTVNTGSYTLAAWVELR